VNFLLVHGAGHGGWCYGRVAPLLRAAGHEVHTPTLTGLGERSHLLDERVDLDLHITDIVNVLRFEDLRDVVLVGHSYGGAVVTGVADRAHERVGRLVYLDAACVRNGQSVADVFGPEVERVRAKGRVVDGVELILLPTADGGPFYGVTDPGDRAWMAGRLTAMPWRCFEQPLRLSNEAAVAAIPTYYIVCTSSVTLPDENTMEDARACGRFWSIDTGHDLMISDARAVARALLEVTERR
jgi:pimeloyl-ACP methyl ester carboxylesterase